MDLALNNLQMLICHKTQTTKQQPTILSSRMEVLFPWNEVIIMNEE